jgi:hypothetical protein
MPPIAESVRDNGLAHYNRVRHNNQVAVGDIPQRVGEKLVMLIINIEESAVVPGREIDVAILPTSPPLPPPAFAPTLQLPTTTKTMQPQWADESNVRIYSRPAAPGPGP